MKTAPEALVLATCEVAIEQWMTGLPDDNVKLRPHRWDRFYAASDRLERLGVVVGGEIYYPRSMRKTLRKAFKDF
jgi:hypothetical protein